MVKLADYKDHWADLDASTTTCDDWRETWADRLLDAPSLERVFR
ncbi:MAG: hypothetical protein AAGD06_19890 [Acidobacteriota bacterium]